MTTAVEDLVIELVCARCGTRFLRTRRQHADSVRLGHAHAFCSHACVSAMAREARGAMEWTEEQKDFIRANYPALSHKEIAKRIGRTWRSVAVMVCRLGVGTRRPWTEEEDDYLRRNKGRMAFEEIGRKLGRSRAAVNKRSFEIGIARRYPARDRAAMAEIERLCGEGLMDGEIGERLNLCPQTVGRIRKKLGLAAHHWHEPRARGLANQSRKRSGKLARTMESMKQARRARAAELGWPQAKTELQARILELLSSGPKTAKAIAEATGQTGRGDAGLTANAPLRSLLKGRLVVSQKVPGSPENLYGLALGIERQAPGEVGSIDPMKYHRLVCKLAIKYGADRRAVVDSDQYIAGLEGLARAQVAYRADRGTKFITLAHHCIENAIRRSCTKLPGPLLTAFSQMGDEEGDAASVLAIAPHDEPEAPPVPPEVCERLMSCLDDRSRFIVRECVMKGRTLEDVAQSLVPSISKARVQQILAAAIEKMRRRGVTQLEAS